MRPVDVIVVGLGHAGCEAALACARMGLSTVAVTLSKDRAGVMSCNPAIGGTAKGHLVRELDALGGEMAFAADWTGTHFKTLNQSKGPAVRASRVLCDRDAYALRMQETLRTQPNLSLVQGEVLELLVDGGRVQGIKTEKHELTGKTVILTTGTFLQALMHLGAQKQVGGRFGDDASNGLSQSLRAHGFVLGRFKTGTPARLSRRTIDFVRCEEQPGDASPRPLSFRTSVGSSFPRTEQLLCHIAFTNARTHRCLRDNLHRSPLFRREIEGRGPRYCPSLEDKVVRFPDRPRHQVFLEPEGPGSDLVYPAGLSTSMPAEVQLEFLRTIEGLEEVEVVRFGYAVEYDFAPPTQLLPTLETRHIRGLYFAGQLNGTSGYEEAAVQGLLAGINAGLAVKGEPALVLGRNEAHAAVLVDDLVTKGVDEPFRMFTSRSEHRLKLREGNADLRLRHHAHRVGLATTDELRRTKSRREAIGCEVARLKQASLSAQLKRPEVTYQSLSDQDSARPLLPSDVTEEVEIEIKYEGYIAQSERSLSRGRSAWDHWIVPPELRFEDVPGLSSEAIERLRHLRPPTIGHARAIPGLPNSVLDLLTIHLRKSQPTR